MIFTFKRCIGVEVLHGDLAPIGGPWASSDNFKVPHAWIVDVIKRERSSRPIMGGFLRVDDGDGHGSAQWQVLPAADLLEVRDGDAVVWRAP